MSRRAGHPLDGPRATSPETDREALVALYNATGGPNWNDNNNWLSDVPEWEGVADGNGRVTELYLEGNQVTGEIPRSWATSLDLDLDTAGVGQLRQPEKAGPRREPVERGDTAGVGQPRQPGMAATRNQLAGRYRRMGSLGNLTRLYPNNELSGEIPPELGNLANLSTPREPAERGDTPGVGQPRRARAGPFQPS